METAAPQGRSLDCRIEVNGSSITEQEEVEVKKAKAFIWRPGKGLIEKVEAKISNLEDSDDFEDFQSENEEWKSDYEDYDVATQTVFPEMKTVIQYEEEDWDKEMEDSENNKNSYVDSTEISKHLGPKQQCFSPELCWLFWQLLHTAGSYLNGYPLGLQDPSHSYYY
ncbi:coordinator of PRMT5 and differentiation stimulator isoform X2 [Ahaetulla prasina]|uniref:coordinator of PRMT5 and differentiation stimulator isoform X2 n=1 Tax=Ahaetulla prasina TaxID=499056 RepID=UPI00264A2A95|nr:coordinator of PRMT5 and differentiation stimulator isoform X2 [Ahaetulla prasina]